MHKWHQVRSYARHWLYAVNEHSLHEPFAYDLYTHVIIPGRKNQALPEIELTRFRYKKHKQPIQLRSPGAPSTFKQRSLFQTAFQGSTDARHARILTSLISFGGCRQILELGTSLGITSLYFSTVPNTSVVTLEGDPLLCKEAARNFEHSNNITLVEGNINETLTPVLDKISSVDFVYFDANHQFNPTLNYFEATLPYCHDNTILVFDDIHWSSEMSRAWNHITNHPRVSITMDLYHMGWVFFKPMKEKYHYILSLK